MRPLLYIIFVMIFCSAGFQSYAAETQFFESLYDVPIMPGLEELPEMAMSFDKPDGRISQAAAYSDTLKEDDIAAFYKQSLPQMGWDQKSQGTYVRDGEELKISVEKTGASQLVKFQLKPQ